MCRHAALSHQPVAPLLFSKAAQKAKKNDAAGCWAPVEGRVLAAAAALQAGFDQVGGLTRGRQTGIRTQAGWRVVLSCPTTGASAEVESTSPRAQESSSACVRCREGGGAEAAIKQTGQRRRRLTDSGCSEWYDSSKNFKFEQTRGIEWPGKAGWVASNQR